MAIITIMAIMAIFCNDTQDKVLYVLYLGYTRTHPPSCWVAPPDMKYFKVLVPTMGNIFDQNDEVKRVRTPTFAIHLAVTYQKNPTMRPVNKILPIKRSCGSMAFSAALAIAFSEQS